MRGGAGVGRVGMSWYEEDVVVDERDTVRVTHRGVAACSRSTRAALFWSSDDLSLGSRSVDRLLSLLACTRYPSGVHALCRDDAEIDREDEEEAGCSVLSRPAGLAPACTGRSESNPRLTQVDRDLGIRSARLSFRLVVDTSS